VLKTHVTQCPCSIPTAFKKVQNAEVRAVQTPATLCKRCAISQIKRRGLAFPQRVIQCALATLWGLLERRGRVVSAPRARCKDAV